MGSLDIWLMIAHSPVQAAEKDNQFRSTRWLRLFPNIKAKCNGKGEKQDSAAGKEVERKERAKVFAADV